MSMHIVYCIDTSSLLEAWTRQYPRVVFRRYGKNRGTHRYWSLMLTGGNSNRAGEKEDELGKWAKAQSGLFVPLSHDQTTEVSQILTDFQPLLTRRGA
jgi:hypothetical protein